MKHALLFVPLVLFLTLSASAKTAQKKIQVVATVFPEYDWVREITAGASDGLELTLLSANGTDIHSYQPSIQDMAKISGADIFIYTGGESDLWVSKALKNSGNKNMHVISLLDILGENAKLEEIKEGMQGAEEDCEYDEHVWLSLKNVPLFCNAICDALCQKLPSQAECFKQNTASYCAKLSALDKQYSDMIKASARDTLLFADRFPFRYFTDDYSLNYYAAFSGCSAETEASFKTIVFLAQKTDELSLPYIIIIETGDKKLAQTVISAAKNKNVSILTLNSMQGITLRQAQNGVTYLGIMQTNYDVLKTALN